MQKYINVSVKFVSMAHKIAVEHHRYKRKLKGDIPSKDYHKNFVDKVIYVFVFLIPALATEQVWRIWRYKEASGVSLVAWIVFTVNSSVWLYYGILHKEKPIIISSILWLFVDLGIVAGVLVYG